MRSASAAVPPAAVVVVRDGIEVPGHCEVTIDVCFDGHRVWSFHPVREGRQHGAIRRLSWPPALEPHLDGITQVSLREHVSGRVLYDEEVRLGTSTERLRILNSRGQPMAVAKSGALERMFAERQSEVVTEIVDAIDRLLQVLRGDGRADAFLAFGGLLGAVRTGHMIGHDTDADVAYVSRYTHPLDVILGSYQLERAVQSHGFRTRRLSGGTFKAMIPMVDGGHTGVDVFSGFYADGVFHLMPGVRGELPLSALLPTSTVTLEGRELPAPADPEALLALTYGDGWRVPDPAFRYAAPLSTRRRLDGWMRGQSAHREKWGGRVAIAVRDRRMQRPSPFAEWVLGRGRLADTVVDVGCGNGRDTLAFAEAGARVIGYDYAMRQVLHARRRAARAQSQAEFRRLNFYENRQVLSAAALLSHEHVGRPVDVYARFLLTAMNDQGRDNFWRFTGMVLRHGGRAYVEFRTTEDRRTPHTSAHWRHFLDPDDVIGEAERIGATVEEMRQGRGLAPFGDEDPHVAQLVLKGG